MEEETTLEFELPVAPPMSNPFAAHLELTHALNLPPDDTLLWRIFDILAGLCDPFTQPEDNDTVPLSVHTLSSVAITLSYQTLVDIRREAAADGKREGEEKALDSALDAEENDSDEESPVHKSPRDPWVTFDNPEVASLRFTLSAKFFAILQAISRVLRADDELRVRYLNNDVKNWEATAKYWLPSLGDRLQGLDSNDRRFSDLWLSLKLLYYICCVVIMALHRLFAPSDGSPYNQALNPYLEHFLRLWKTHTSIIALALEMDRELEEEAWVTKLEYLDTPYIVKRTLLGSSAVRCVLAYVLEPTQGKDFSKLKDNGVVVSDHGPKAGPLVPKTDDLTPQLGENGRPCLENDLFYDSLLDFYDPLARTAKGCGAIGSDKRLHAVVALVRRLLLSISPFSAAKSAKGDFDPNAFPHFDHEDYLLRVKARDSPYGSASDLSVDVYYQDQFDDDIKYVFGYFDSDDEESGSPSSKDDNESVKSDVVFGMAERQMEDEIEFDEQGRDWRDCARGKNTEFTAAFLLLEAELKKLGDERLSDHFFFTWFELQQALEFLALAKIENVDTFIHRVGQVTVNTVAKAIGDEMHGRFNKISPDKIHKHLVSLVRADLFVKAHEELPLLEFFPTTNFELILLRNPYCALALLDELFMCKGLRRSLIWFLTHNVNPLIMLISYVYEFVSGLRGNSNKRQSKYKFSRQGHLEITPVEQLMILHELFTLVGTLASADEPKISQLTATRIILCLCVMIKNLVLNNIIKKNTDDQFENYAHDIQVVLVPWIGKVPEARDLFFMFKLEDYRAVPEPEDVLELQEKTAQDVGDILEVIDSLRGLDPAEYAIKLQEKEVVSCFRSFAMRLFSHINLHFGELGLLQSSLPVASKASKDYGLFLTHFNELARNSTFVDAVTDMMDQHEAIIAQDDKLPNCMDGGAGTQLDSEFSDAFLNGEGDFQESSPASDKKKKKKPKKKRGKKR